MGLLKVSFNQLFIKQSLNSNLNPVPVTYELGDYRGLNVLSTPKCYVHIVIPGTCYCDLFRERVFADVT